MLPLTPKLSWIKHKQNLFLFYFFKFHSFPGYQGEKKNAMHFKKLNAFCSAHSVFQNGQLFAEDIFRSRICPPNTLKNNIALGGRS
jgi:hypothetical protein